VTIATKFRLLRITAAATVIILACFGIGHVLGNGPAVVMNILARLA